jgi:hypothetical protein
MLTLNAIDSHINTLVMDYLVMEGYPIAAQNFAAEANIQPNASIESIGERVEIRNLIYKGDIKNAIEKVNELNAQVCFQFFSILLAMIMLVHAPLIDLFGGVDDKKYYFSPQNEPNTKTPICIFSSSVRSLMLAPQILDRDSSLHFALLRLQLVELIRACTTTPDGDITPALEFATTHLAPRAPTNPDFLQDLEQTMTLLIFSQDNLAPSLSALLDPGLRKDVANRVNEAILHSQGEKTRSKLMELVKTRAWAERKARELKKDVPDHVDIGLDRDRAHGEREDSVMHGNGEPEVITA